LVLKDADVAVSTAASTGADFTHVIIAGVNVGIESIG
jgi:hypothetical protein